jgi:LysM repeat protein
MIQFKHPMTLSRVLVFAGIGLFLGSSEAWSRTPPPDVAYPTSHDQQSLEDLLKSQPPAPAGQDKPEPAPVKIETPDEPKAQAPAPPAPERTAAPIKVKHGDVVRTVKPAQPPAYKVWIWQENGDTLWRIAQKVYGDKDKWPLIYAANRDVIKDPNKIYPKQVLKIPPVDWQP